MTPMGPSKLSSFDLRLAQWEEACAAGETPPDGASAAPSRWQAAQRVLEQLDDMFGRSRAPFPQNAAIGGEARFGRFVLRREIGRGGFGVVFLADDPNLGRQVALKIPRPELLLNAEGHERFLHEGRAAATLDHPNIVTVHDAGEIGPVAYIAMAYCPGPTLAEWLKRQPGPMSPRDAATIVAALADAMQHAHSRGVLHRDLKPGNILLQKDEGGRMKDELDPQSTSFILHPSSFLPKIADFGLARRLDDPSQTQTGAVLGTPKYMAPEQAAGRIREVGTHTDIYALGAILYELLTGRPPFEGTSAELVVKVQQDEPAPPRKVRLTVPRDLDTICLKCLEKVPAERYASADALASDLRHWLAGEPISARAVTPVQRLSLWARRKPALATALMLFILALIGGIGGTTWGLIEAREQLARRERADQVDAMLTEAMAANASGSFRRAIQIGEHGAAIMQDLVRRNPSSIWFQWHLAASHAITGDGWRGLEEYQRAVDSYERAAALYRASLATSPDSVQVVGMHISTLERLTATRFLMPNSADEVVRLIMERNQLHQRLEDSPRRNPRDTGMILANLRELGDYFLVEGRIAEAARYYAQAQEFIDSSKQHGWEPEVRDKLRRRLELVARAGNPGVNVPGELLGLLHSAELLLRLQSEFEKKQSYGGIANISKLLSNRFGDFSIALAAARGFARAANLAPLDKRPRYNGECEQLIARLLQFSDEGAERVKAEPLFAPYRHVWEKAK